MDPMTALELEGYETPIERPLKILRAIDSLIVLQHPFLRPVAWWTGGEFECYKVGVFGTNALGLQYTLDIPMSDPQTEWGVAVAAANELLAKLWPERKERD